MLFRIGALLMVLTIAFGGTVAAQDNGMTTFTVRITNISNANHLTDVGVFNTPVGADEAGPAVPGSAYEFTFSAMPGDYVSFATMLVQSNDLFFGPDESGVELYDMDGTPLEGDVTDQVYLWDAGTEVNEEPGVGANQAPRQSGPDTGDAEGGVVHLVDDGFSYPAVNELITVTLTSAGENMFTITIDNISGDSALPTPLAPGVYATHHSHGPLYAAGYPDRGEGLEALAEDGNPSGLLDRLSTVLETPFAPGIFVIHSEPNPLFAAGEADRGEGLEALAEDGDPSVLAGMEMMGVSSAGVFNTPNGADGPGPLLPGESYEFSFDAVPGDHLTFATMLVQSNDLFVGTGGGIALFDDMEAPIQGNLYAELWDAGTEVNEEPGVGENQAPRQAGPNTGEDEGGVVQLVDDGFSYPATYNLVRIQIGTGELSDEMHDDMGEDMSGTDMGSDDMGSDDMGSDDMGSDDMGSDDMGSDDMGSDDMGDAS